MDKTCDTCRFWHINANAELAECRRKSPLKDECNYFSRSWPLTKKDDWCGEYQPLSQQVGQATEA